MTKLLKNRFLIAAVAVVISGILIFSGINLVENQNKTVDVVRLTSMVRRGEVIESDKVSTITIGGYNVSDDYIKVTDDVVGKYALADLYPNDYIQKAKIADELPSVEAKLLQLDGSRVAISINIKDLARGLSDKIMTGDIVSVFATQEEETKLPPELTYLEVVTTTMPDGVDKTSEGIETENLATATLLATPYQAQLLAGYDKTSEIHLALVYRGDKETAQNFLKRQEDALNQLEATPTPSEATTEVVA